MMGLSWVNAVEFHGYKSTLHVSSRSSLCVKVVVCDAA